MFKFTHDLEDCDGNAEDTNQNYRYTYAENTCSEYPSRPGNRLFLE